MFTIDKAHRYNWNITAYVVFLDENGQFQSESNIAWSRYIIWYLVLVYRRVLTMNVY